MTIARSTGALIGTDESTLSSLSNNTSTSSSVTDILGSDAAAGDIWFYLVITSTVAVGTIDVKIAPCRLSGQTYTKVNYEMAVVPSNGTQKVFLGVRPASRFLVATINNNATGATATVGLFYELIKLT